MVRLSGDGLRFIDLWYGSQNIRHKRLGLQVKRDGKWQIEDVDYKELKSLEEVSYLPDSCVDGITSYIIGNRHLKNGESDSAIRSYAKALELYPGNPRFWYNRAIAYERIGEVEKAEADYAQALYNEDAITRVLAREHEEVIALLRLDAKAIDSKAQDMYLLYRGFATGRKVSMPAVARRFGLSENEARAIIYAVEEKVSEN
jgi:tetratricopeptide (TPR) repeat protein